MAQSRPGLTIIDADRARGSALAREVGERGLVAAVATDLSRPSEAGPLFCAVESLEDLTRAGAVLPTELEVFGFGTAAPPDLAGRLSGFLVADPTALAPMIAAVAAAASLRPPKVRGMLELTLLGANPDVDLVMRQLAALFGADGCCALASGPSPVWLGASDPDDQPAAGWIERNPGAIGVPTFAVPSAGAPLHTFLGCALHPPGQADLGNLWLVSRQARRFSAVARASLALCASRLANELWWVSAHNRLVLEHDKLRESAPTDAVTDLWARDAFEQLATAEIAAAQRRNERMALAILDVIGLRQLNDRHGHLAGDAVLAHFARTVRANLRVSDLVGRFGGSEIAVLLPGASSEVARPVVAKLVDRVARAPVWHHGVRIELAIRAGLTEVDHDEGTGEAAFRRARAALVEARHDDRAIAISLITDAGADGDEVAGDDLALPPGTTLGGMYRILHELSRGAMGVVYRAEDMGLGRAVAIKVLRSDLARDRELVAHFRREAATLAAIHHRHLVQVYSFGSEDQEVYFVMELVEGEALADVLIRLQDESEQIDLAVVAQVVEEIADALEAMHDAGVIHRDVKPANILLDEVGDRAVLVDVGVAKRRDDRSLAAGTPGFAAPESFTDEAETTATDVYGLAATIYTALTKFAPFGSGGVLEIVERQMAGPPPAPSDLRPGLSTAVDQVLFKALDPDQSRRYDSAATFAVALASALRRTPTMTLAPARAIRPTAAPTPAPSMTLQGSQAAALLAGDRKQTRGAVFRVAYKLFTHHLGSAWVRRLCESDESLAEVFRGNLSPTCWRPLDRLRAALELSDPAPERQAELARVLGRAVMTVTFARFFGADPGSLRPLALLRAAASCWPRYHSWGRLEIDGKDGATAGAVTLLDSPGDPVVCALVAGSLVRIAELAGATAVTVEETACGRGGGTTCRFELTWTPPTPAGHS